jgi:hypothetical protein
MSDKVDPVTAARQANCQHAVIQGLLDKRPICPHCGLVDPPKPQPAYQSPFGRAP